jgi:hypothetical protein
MKTRSNYPFGARTRALPPTRVAPQSGRRERVLMHVATSKIDDEVKHLDPNALPRTQRFP